MDQGWGLVAVIFALVWFGFLVALVRTQFRTAAATERCAEHLAALRKQAVPKVNRPDDAAGGTTKGAS